MDELNFLAMFSFCHLSYSVSRTHVIARPLNTFLVGASVHTMDELNFPAMFGFATSNTGPLALVISPCRITRFLWAYSAHHGRAKAD
jgi:hypothetical protein